jgi:hypothetical protein
VRARVEAGITFYDLVQLTGIDGRRLANEIRERRFSPWFLVGTHLQGADPGRETCDPGAALGSDVTVPQPTQRLRDIDA